MKRRFALPFRQIHLDFHTGPWVSDVGRDFDAREFARTMKRAHVNSVTVFAKCHHGHLYYNTKRPERHPGLKPGLDLLAGQVEALHREGIRAPIYISVQCDEYAANTHPEWIALRTNAAHVKNGNDVFKPAWQIVDMSSPYQDYLAEQTREVLKLFKPVDGIFFDMCWDQPSVSKWAVAGMERMGLHPEKEEDRNRYARRVALAYMQRFHRMTRAASPNATVFFNCRPFFNLAEDIRFQEQVEIEALPTGGWGYMYFPKNVRYARTFRKPYMGMTARFHKSWADFGGLKPYAALEYETSQMIAHGARCSIGDQLHPRGTLDAGAYELIGRAYARVAAREPWVQDAAPVSEIGLFQLPSGVLGTTQSSSRTDEGATRMLTHLKHQFDVISAISDLRRYKVIILPDAIPVDAALAAKLRSYLRGGGALLATGTSGLSADGLATALPELGIRPAGLSPFTSTYLRFGREIGAGVPPSDHVMYERGIRVTAVRGTRILARVVEPYFERAWNHFCSHNQTPGARLTRFAAATQRGRCAFIPFPVFSAYAVHGNYPYRLLVGNILARLLPEPLVRTNAPLGAEIVLARQTGRTIVHALYYPAERRTQTLDVIEDLIVLRDVALSIRHERPARRVYLAPDGIALPFTVAGDRVNICIPEMRGHAMIVIEG